MGPKSQELNDKSDSSTADANLVVGLDATLLNVPNLADQSDQSGGAPESWAAKPVNIKGHETVQKEKLDFDALRIFIVLGLLTAAMAVGMKFLF